MSDDVESVTTCPACATLGQFIGGACAACDYTDNGWCDCECHDGDS
jgi:hypothetical protein